MAETTRSARTGDDTTRKAPAKRPARKAAKKTAKSAPRPAARPDADDTAGSRGTPRGAQVALVGAEQLVELTGKEFEGIVGIAKTDDGWTIQVELLEMRRIPTTTDVLAAYEVTLDPGGDLMGYRRTDRYVRGSAREERT